MRSIRAEILLGALAVCAAWCWSTSAHAEDALEMMSGMTLRGEFVSESDAAITFLSSGAQLTYPKAKVHALTAGGKRKIVTPKPGLPADASPPVTQAPPPVAQPAAVTPPAAAPPPPVATNAPPGPKPNTLAQALSAVKVPPDWMAATPVNWDVNKPWKDGRLEIRRLLGFGTVDGNREAIKLTWLYFNKKDIGDGHELPLYLLLGAEFAWAVKAHEEFIAQQAAAGKYPLYPYKSLAACYMHFGAYDKAYQVLNHALQLASKQTPQQRDIMEAGIHSMLGDLFLEQGKNAEAKKEYTEAARLYPLANPTYGKHLLPRRVAIVQAKLALIDAKALGSVTLKDGSYPGSALGYTGPIDATVIVKAGKLADIQLNHTEKIDNNATILVPAQIIKKQSLQVDNITAATVSTEAIKAATLEALRKAGL